MRERICRDLFLSYAWRDHAQVAPIAAALQDEHQVRVFLDRWSIRPGHSWVSELEAALADCRAIAVMIGPGPMESWQQREVNFALRRNSRDESFIVIPVLLPGADPATGFLGEYHWIDLRTRPPDRAEIARLAEAALGPAHRLHIPSRPATCPYRGLLYFREEDAPFFFGRDAAIQQLSEAVGQRQFVALVGASGSGKSSVVRAGLVPQLRRQRDQVWEIATLMPGDRPLRSLAAGLIQLLERDMHDVDRLICIAQAEAALSTKQLAIRDLVQKILEKQPGTNRLLLVVDQWEELYTLTTDESVRRHFIDELLTACESVPTSIVVTLRGDFVGHALGYRRLADRLQGAQVNLGPMNRAELALAIREPARRVGITFERGLDERILDDAGDEPGNLPLLEFVLEQLWEERRDDVLLYDAYNQMGCLQGAVAKKADQIFDRLSREQQQAMQRIFLQLAAPAEEGQYVRRRASLALIGDESDTVLRHLTNERLLVTSPGHKVGDETVELSHEALISSWDKLRSWLDEDREFLLWRRRFNEFLAAWREDQQTGTLLTANFLTEAMKWLNERSDRLSLEERYYIATSEMRYREEKQKARRRTRAFIAAVSLFGIIAIGFALDSQRQKRLAEDQATTAFALQLAAQSRQRVEANLAEALLLGVAAVDFRRIHETEDNLLRLLRSIPTGLRGIQAGHTGAVWGVAFSPDGKMLATGSRDRTVILWDVATMRPLAEPLTADAAAIWSIAFSPDGKQLATGSSDGHLRMWDVATRQLSGARLTAHAGGVWTIAYSPDGRTLASAGADSTVVLWDVATRKMRGKPLRGHTDEIWSVAFDPTGSVIATGAADRKIMLWNVATGERLRQPLTSRAEVWSVAFSPDGKLLASAGDDNAVLLWDVAGRRLAGEPLRGHTSEVWSVVFHPDGKSLATASWDHSVILWDLATRKPLRDPLRAHRDSVTTVALSPDGNTIASGSLDRTVILWDVTGGTPVGQPLRGHDGEVLSAAFSADGQTLATAGDDETILIWDVTTRSRIGKPLRRHTDEIWTLAFSPDGKIIASGSRDRSIILWNLATQEPLGEPLKAHDDEVLSVVFSPAEKMPMLATGGDDGRVILWDVATRTPVGEPLQRADGEVRSIAFSPDGRMLAAGWDQSVILWDVVTRTQLGTALTGHTDAVVKVAFSPDGKTLASAGRDRRIILWDVEQHRAQGEPLMRHVDEVTSIAFAADGHTLTTLSKDGMVIEWDVRNRKAIGEPLLGGLSEALSAAIAPDTHTFATGGRDGTVILSQADRDNTNWRPHVCRILNRNFTLVEWRRYMGERPYRRVCPDAPLPNDSAK